MSENNSIFNLGGSCPIIDETNKCLDYNSILSVGIKNEIHPHQNNVSNQSYHNENGNVINKSNNITFASFSIDADNVLEIKTEKDFRNSSVFVTEEIDIKEGILTYQNNDDINGSCHTEENETVNNSNYITMETLDPYIQFKTEDYTSIQNCVSAIEGGCSVNVENDSFPSTSSFLLSSVNNENTTIQYSNGNPLSYNAVINNIEQMSPEYCDTFKDNISDIKSEVDDNSNNFEKLTTVLINENEDVNNSNIIQLETNVNSVKNVHGKLYDCNICQKSFTQKRYLTRHMVIHTCEKLHKCNICQRSFALKDKLNNHMFTHVNETPHKCIICQKSFTLNAHLNKHMVIHTGEKPYKCNICQKSFIQKGHLNRHLVIHTGEKPHECNICQRSFALKDKLNIHMFTHANETPHKCIICQKSFTLNAHLSRHMAIHTGEKPYKCNICQKSFALKDKLNNHMFTHVNEAPYKCNICKKSFIQKYNLKRHMVIHTGEKPYKCNICKKSFIQKYILKRHEEIHTDDKP